MSNYVSIVNQADFNLETATLEQLNEHFIKVVGKACSKLCALKLQTDANQVLKDKLAHTENLLKALATEEKQHLNEEQLKLLISTVSYATRVMVYGTSEDKDVFLKPMTIEDIQNEFGITQQGENGFVKEKWEETNTDDEDVVHLHGCASFKKVFIDVDLADYDIRIENGEYYLDTQQTANENQENAKQLGLCALELEKIGYGRVEQNWKNLAVYALGLSVVALVISGVILSAGLGAIPASMIAMALSVSTASVSAVAPAVVIGGASVLAASSVSVGALSYAGFYAHGTGAAKSANDLEKSAMPETKI